LELTFDVDTTQTINFSPVLVGPVHGVPADTYFFDQVSLNPEVNTLFWPNGADFDPMTLLDWPMVEERMVALVKRSADIIDG
jgi:hypothetical protein